MESETEKLAQTCARREETIERGLEFVGLEPERAGFAFVGDATTGVDQVHPVGPAGVGLFGRVAELVEDRLDFDSELADARSGDDRALVFVFGAGEYDFIFNIALHLPEVARMRLGDVDDEKLDSIAEFVVELVECGNLPPEGRSRIAAENQHNRSLLSGKGTQLHVAGFV